MKNIQLELTIDDTNLILEALGALPFVRVYALIGRIQESARKQIGDQAVDPGPGGPGASHAPGAPLAPGAPGAPGGLGGSNGVDREHVR